MDVQVRVPVAQGEPDHESDDDLMEFLAADGVIAPSRAQSSCAGFGAAAPRHPLGASQILNSAKAELLESLLEQEGSRARMKLPLTAGVLIEDDETAIEVAQRRTPNDEYDWVVSKGRLNTVYVSQKKGMRPDVEMKELLKKADA